MSRSELTASTFIPQAESTLASFMSTIGEGGYDSLRDSQQKRARLYVSELRRMDQMLNVLVVQYVDDPVRLEQLIGLKECFDTVLETYGATVPTEAGQELPEVTDEMLALAMPPSAPTPASVFTSTSASSTATTASGAATSAAGGSADLPQERERPDPPTPREDDEEVECSICYDEQRWGDMVELGCYHRFCKECVAEYLNKKIEVADVVNIQCLDSSCDWPISSDEIRDLVDADAFKKFERFSILASIRTDPTARYCCKPECEGVHVGAPAPGSNKITCPECGEEMCYECSRAWHEGFCKPRKLTKEERKTERWMRRKGVQNCPECGVGTVRFGGCPTIDCPGPFGTLKLCSFFRVLECAMRFTKLTLCILSTLVRLAVFYCQHQSAGMSGNGRWKGEKKRPLKSGRFSIRAWWWALRGQRSSTAKRTLEQRRFLPAASWASPRQLCCAHCCRSR
eukprot:TRINITY_DN2333_c0_g1_i2.p1 TRINITY_DN2333_c0_g1~~TRINITY_DN2333_c0_g1_i2.p1  ORF type:complete len:507 (+),score=70.12 TRINITY_DN2333_c0_g1_i2:154-1521(+)